jgi:hypothetical protein
MQQVATAEFRTQCIFPAAGSSTTILVIEDERLVREATCEFLRAWRYRVLAACDGAVARKTFADHREEISLLVCDIVRRMGMALSWFLSCVRLQRGCGRWLFRVIRGRRK